MNWNDSVKKIIDFIPKFEQIQKDVDAFSKIKFATDFDDSEIKKEICEIKNKIGVLCNYDDKSILSKISDISLLINEIKPFDDANLMLEIDSLHKKLDSSQRTFSELYEQKIQLASQEQITLISGLLAENDKLRNELKNKESNNG